MKIRGIPTGRPPTWPRRAAHDRPPLGPPPAARVGLASDLVVGLEHALHRQAPLAQPHRDERHERGTRR